VEAQAKAETLAQQYLYRKRGDDLSVFSRALDSIAKLAEMSRKLPVLEKVSSWYIPFIRTPVNVGIMMTEFSPLGAVRPLNGWNAEVASKVIMGSMMTAIGACFAQWGDTTWTPPSDEKTKTWFYSTGRKPFSVKIGEHWLPFWYLGPFSLAFGIPAAIKHYAIEQKQALDSDAVDKIVEIAGGLARFIASQSSTQSLGNLFALLDGDIDFTFPKQMAQLVGQMLAGSAVVRQINNIIDPVL
jgi:hypothetical protein